FGTAFAAVVVFTMGSATAIVPTADGARSSRDATPPASAHAPIPSTPVQPGAVGGTLVVTGDREGTMVLGRETTQDRYGLVGANGRILFEGDPPTVARVQYDGLEFFVDPDECTVIPGERHDPSGVAGADIRCEAIEDVRGGGVIGLRGRIGVAADLFGLRGDLPPSGGIVAVGDERLVLEEAQLDLGPRPAIAGEQGFRLAADAGFLHLAYDPEGHEISLLGVQLDGPVAEIPDGACSVITRPLGVLNPRVTVVEMTLQCSAVQVEGLGTVPVEGSVIVDVAELPR
ncbi:MAG: hypothetical protein KY392_03195, partial [Chloroflexi bacterium]|nr:hypothetical protein [Chloroflexota bacterium]